MSRDFDLLFLVEYMNQIKFLWNLLLFFLFTEEKHRGFNLFVCVLIICLVPISVFIFKINLKFDKYIFVYF